MKLHIEHNHKDSIIVKANGALNYPPGEVFKDNTGEYWIIVSSSKSDRGQKLLNLHRFMLHDDDPIFADLEFEYIPGKHSLTLKIGA